MLRSFLQFLAEKGTQLPTFHLIIVEMSKGMGIVSISVAVAMSKTNVTEFDFAMEMKKSFIAKESCVYVCAEGGFV